MEKKLIDFEELCGYCLFKNEYLQCTHGSNTNIKPSANDCPIWKQLKTSNE